MSIEEQWDVSVKNLEKFRQYRNHVYWGNFVILSSLVYLSKIILFQLFSRYILKIIALVEFFVSTVLILIPLLYLFHIYRIKKQEIEAVKIILSQPHDYMPLKIFILWLIGVLFPVFIISDPAITVISLCIALSLMYFLQKKDYFQFKREKIFVFGSTGLFIAFFVSVIIMPRLFYTIILNLFSVEPLSPVADTTKINPLDSFLTVLNSLVSITFLIIGFLITKNAFKILETSK